MSHKYDLAISFAGEQRDLARRFALRLDASGYSIFYDEFQQAELWAKDLSIVLANVYSREARYCLVVLSREYVEKPWTNQERRSAIENFIHRNSNYILCLKVHDVELPGFSSVMGYLSLDRTPEDSVYKLLLEKLGRPNHENQISRLNAADVNLAKQIIEACFRRAIYTRMNSEIDLSAMYGSVGSALRQLQTISPRIRDQVLQYACNEIIQALDDVERVKTLSSERVSNHLTPQLRSRIDQNKQKVVRLLLEIRRASNIPMQLPFALQTDHFWGAQAADEPPTDDAN